MILLRHGESAFNVVFSVNKHDPGIPDPALTPRGHAQAEAAADLLAGQPISRIIVSPYTRALQTARPVAARLGVAVTISPDVRERCAFSCDIGTPASALAAAWPEHDFSALQERWWPDGEEEVAAAITRAARFRAAMAESADWARTLVISHWGFILALSGERIANGALLRHDPTAPPPAIRPDLLGPYLPAR